VAVVDDQILMARVQEGEQTALEQLFARWEAPLFAFFYRLGCPPGAVEDLVEEVLVSVYRQRRRYDTGRPFAPWVYGIARLVWKEHQRRRGREGCHLAPLEAAQEMASDDRTPLHAAEAREEADAVRAAIQRLPEEQRVTVLLRHYHGLRYDEIAEALQVPLGTVKWRIHDALRRLQGWLAVAPGKGA